MSIRVGRCIYKGSKRIDPEYDEFKQILVLMKSHSKWGVLGPYHLTLKVGDDDVIFENYYQMSKVYPSLPRVKLNYSQYNKTVIWDYPAHIQLKGSILTPEYFKWREAGMKCQYHLRYPFGYGSAGRCIFSLHQNSRSVQERILYDEDKLDYITARKQIYVTGYINCVRKEPKFEELKTLLQKGKNLLISEVDGPHQESLSYYKKQYGVEDDFIESDTMLATEDNINIMLNDSKHPVGHGYCLAMALLDYSKVE